MEDKKRWKPKKLERQNATKNIDYQAPPTTTAHSTSSFDLTPSSLGHQTSFRVMGIDGEFEHICRTLGLSGPEDFAIPTEAWEAQKARFASRNAKKVVKDVIPAKFETGVVRNSDIELKNQNFQPRVEGKHWKLDVSSDSKVLGCNKDGGGGGIKGVRPPALAPPPVILRPIVDNVSSNWDLMRSFSPQDDDAVVDSSFRRERGVEENDDFGGVEALNVVRRGERNLYSSSSSYTSHDDDSDVGGEKASSLFDESVHSVSRNGLFRRSFSSWQKGEILGKGSFGTVYEGFTDDGFFFAVKEVSLLDEGSQGQQSIFQLQQEISLLSRFKHENIVRYLGTDKDKSTLYIFLELASKGSLASLYRKYRLKDSQVSAYTRQILSGLKYLHDRNVVHR